MEKKKTPIIQLQVMNKISAMFCGLLFFPAYQYLVVSNSVTTSVCLLIHTLIFSDGRKVCIGFKFYVLSKQFVSQ